MNNLTFALWITGIRLGDFGFWGEKKNEYARWCFFGVLAFASSGYSAKPFSLIGGACLCLGFASQHSIEASMPYLVLLGLAAS